MKKAYTYFILSLIILILGIVFTISGVLLQTLPLSSKSALLIFSTAFIIIGVTSSAVHYRKYILIQKLFSNEPALLARWTYSSYSSSTLKSIIKSEKVSTLATAILILILALIFSIVFAYSGGTYILCLGYIFAFLSILTFIIARRFITVYYDHLSASPTEVLFAENMIYFLDEIYPLQRTFYELQKVNLYLGTEALLIFEYNMPDIDDPDACNLVIPVPHDKIKTATYLKHYYSDLIESQ